jgi:hypothetical protein
MTKRPYQFLNTLEENLGFLSPRQQKRAKIARELYEAMGTPTVDDLKAMIWMNLIKNNVVTTDDVNLAIKAYGPDVGAIKGKTTRSKPTPVTSNILEIPDELLEVQQDLTLSMDGLTVNSLKFLSTISHDLYYRTTQYVARSVASIYEECMDELLALYKRGGFTISTIHCDNEFHKVMDPLSARQDPPITMNYAATQEHVPRAEQNNRVIQERVRVAYHRFPFTHLPRILVKYLVMESTKKLNFFPNKNGVSKYFSPRMIMHQETLDYARHCKYQIGEYVQAHDEPDHTNTNAPRSLDCIYLRPMDNAQGGHELLHLQTNRVVKRRKMTKIPITPNIIKQVHALAVLDEMPEGLKITNRANNVIFDTAWITGVDYYEQEFDDEYDKEEENEDDDDDDYEDHYDRMDENELADILQQPNEHQEAHEPEDPEAPENEEHEIVFEVAEEEAEEEYNEELFEDHDDEEYEHEDEQDVSL